MQVHDDDNEPSMEICACTRDPKDLDQVWHGSRMIKRIAHAGIVTTGSPRDTDFGDSSMRYNDTTRYRGTDPNSSGYRTQEIVQLDTAKSFRNLLERED